MAFSGVLSLSAVHFLAKTGHLGEELACPNPSPHEMHDGEFSLVQTAEE